MFFNPEAQACSTNAPPPYFCICFYTNSINRFEVHGLGFKGQRERTEQSLVLLRRTNELLFFFVCAQLCVVLCSYQDRFLRTILFQLASVLSICRPSAHQPLVQSGNRLNKVFVNKFGCRIGEYAIFFFLSLLGDFFFLEWNWNGNGT